MSTEASSTLRNLRLDADGSVRMVPGSVPSLVLCPVCRGKHNVHCMHCGDTGLNPVTVLCPFCVGNGCRVCGQSGRLYERELKSFIKDS